MRTLKIFKKTASMWFSYKEGVPYEEGRKERDACVFLSMTPASGSREYNSDAAILLALNYWDLTAILEGCDRRFWGNPEDSEDKRGVGIVHNYDGTIKTLRVGAGDLDKDGFRTYGWYLKVGDVSYTVYTSECEMFGGGLGISGYLRNCAHMILND